MVGGLLAFYPTLAYNLVRNYVQPNSWTWYSRVDDHLIIGAMPFKSMIEDLKKENVCGVVCCTEEFELAAVGSAVQPKDWDFHGIRFYHLPMKDFTGSTSRENIEQAVQFVGGIAAEGKTCYVHCKAGRTRSATVAACYLMQKYKYLPNVAWAMLSEKRPQALLRSAHWRTLNEYQRHLDASAGRGEEMTQK